MNFMTSEKDAVNFSPSYEKKFDEIPFGTHFLLNDKKYIKIKNVTEWLGWSVYYQDSYGNRNRFNAVGYDGGPATIGWDENIKVIESEDKLTDLGFTHKQENELLWQFVSIVAMEGICQCGNGLFINGHLCPTCFALQYAPQTDKVKTRIGEINRTKQNNEEIKKVVDTDLISDTVEESKLKNKQIETTMNTFNTLKEAVIAAINEIKANGSLSAYQITQFIRGKVQTEWEVLDCVARPNGQGIKFWINHDDVRRIVNEMYVNAELDVLGFVRREFNGTYLVYYFDTATPVTSPTVTVQSTTPNVSVTFVGATSPATDPVVRTRVNTFLQNQLAENKKPTMKQIQSALKINGITCQDFYTVVSSLGYNVILGDGGINEPSKHYVE